VAVTGVQPKLSLHLEKKRRASGRDSNSARTKDRLTIVGLWGAYIFKPPTEKYPELPEIEDQTMHLADVAAIKTVPHSLIRFRSKELAYITRRIDRIEKSGAKLPMEDMCQLTKRLTEDKYGGLEQIRKVIRHIRQSVSM
jgi:serine/threonine-protein kinase HipA